VFPSGGGACDIRVNGQGGSFTQGYTDKGGERLYYRGDLIYASIVADEDNYECNLKRLMMRTSNLANLYLSESQYLKAKGCNSGTETSLSLLINTITSQYDSSLDLITKVVPVTETVNKNNICNLW